MGRDRQGIYVLLLLFTLSLIQSADCTEPIGILYMGSIGRGKPYLLIRSDPLFSITIVQASLRSGDFPLNIIHEAQKVDVVPRLLRLYMPRSYSDLVSRFDVIVFNNANAIVMADYNQMLRRA